MSMIKFPPEFAQQRILLSDINDQNASLGADSPIAAFLLEKEIDLSADLQAGIDAQTQEDNRAKNESTSITAYQNRDAGFSIVFKFVKQAAQMLKKFYAPGYGKLLDWSIPITDSGRIVYPTSFEDCSDMCNKFITKLNSYGAGKSPLQPFLVSNNIDVVKMLSLLTDAIKNNTLAITSSKAAENCTEQRNLLWKMANEHIHLIGDFLKSIYPNNPRALGEWGFVVDESTSTVKARRVKFMIGETRVLQNTIIGSIVTNLGKGDAIIYQGKGTSGAMTVLKANDKMGILKGYSIITVVNPSTLETLELSILPPEK
jgi:hypothetical protein